MTERCRSCGGPLPDDPNWTIRMCRSCIEQEKPMQAPGGSRSIKARKPGECGRCGVPLLSDERERGVCGACVKKSKFDLIHPHSHEMDGALPPTVAGWVKNEMDLFDERRPSSGKAIKDWELGYAYFTKELGHNSNLVVLGFHMNGGKEVVVWRQGDEVSLLRFPDEATDGLKPVGGSTFLVMPNGLVVQGFVNRMNETMSSNEVNVLIQNNRERILQRESWGAGKFRRRHAMIVCVLTRDARLTAPEAPAIAMDETPRLTGPVVEPVAEEEEETL